MAAGASPPVAVTRDEAVSSLGADLRLIRSRKHQAFLHGRVEGACDSRVKERAVLGDQVNDVQLLRHRESASLAIPGHGGDAAGRQQVNHVARADFGRTEVDGVLAAIGKVVVALTARDGDDDGSQTPKAVLEAARARSLYGKLTILTLVPCMGELTLLIGLVMFSQLTYPVCGDQFLWDLWVRGAQCVLLFSGAMVSLALFLAAFSPLSTPEGWCRGCIL